MLPSFGFTSNVAKPAKVSLSEIRLFNLRWLQTRCSNQRTNTESKLEDELSVFISEVRICVGMCRRARQRWAVCRSRKRSCALRSVTSACLLISPPIHYPTSRNSFASWRARPAREHKKSPRSPPKYSSSNRCFQRTRTNSNMFSLCCLFHLVSLFFSLTDPHALWDGDGEDEADPSERVGG